MSVQPSAFSLSNNCRSRYSPASRDNMADVPPRLVKRGHQPGTPAIKSHIITIRRDIRPYPFLPHTGTQPIASPTNASSTQTSHHTRRLISRS